MRPVCPAGGGLSGMKDIATVWLFATGMVMVFDIAGKQLSHYQGHILHVGEHILQHLREDVDFRYSFNLKTEHAEISKTLFKKKLQLFEAINQGCEIP